MRIREPSFWALLFVLAVITSFGCGRNKPPPPSSDVQVLDATQFRPSFSSAPPETQALVNKIMLSLGSSDFIGALSQLETLTNTPGLTDQQQKVAASLTDQITKKLAAIPP